MALVGKLRLGNNMTIPIFSDDFASICKVGTKYQNKDGKIVYASAIGFPSGPLIFDIPSFIYNNKQLLDCKDLFTNLNEPTSLFYNNKNIVKPATGSNSNLTRDEVKDNSSYHGMYLTTAKLGSYIQTRFSLFYTGYNNFNYNTDFYAEHPNSDLIDFLSISDLLKLSDDISNTNKCALTCFALTSGNIDVPYLLVTASLSVTQLNTESGYQYAKKLRFVTIGYINPSNLNGAVLNPITISISSSTGGTARFVGDDQTGTYFNGDICSVIATPNDGYSFDGWYNGSKKVSGLERYNFFVTESVNLTAKFTKANVASFALSVNNLSAGSIGTAATPNGNYEINTVVTCLAVPASDKIGFLGWKILSKGANQFPQNKVGDIVSTQITFRFTLRDDVSLVAMFDSDTEYTVNVIVNPANGGYVEIFNDGSLSKTFKVNQLCTVKAHANYNYKFKNFSEVGKPSNVLISRDTYSFYVTKDVNIQANFYYSPAADNDPYNPDKPSGGGSIGDDKPSGWMELGKGFYKIFTPTAQQFNKLGRWLYSDNFITEVIDKGLKDIDLTSLITTLHVLPVNIQPDGVSPIRVGWWTVSDPDSAGNDLQVAYTNSNYVELDCGTIHLDPVYNGALDYQTTIQIYLPFIGYQPLETYDVIDTDIKAKYQIDLVTGDCICKLFINDVVKYQFTGNASYTIPLSQTNMNGIVQKGITSALGVLSATGVVPPVVTAGGSTHSVTRSRVNRGRSGEITSRSDTVDSGYESTVPLISPREAIGVFTNLGTGGSRGGQLSGNTGYLGVAKPYLLIVKPNLDMPKQFGFYNGYPCNKYLKLGDLHGYTEVEEIHLEDFSCTDSELSEIESMLQDGVIL